MDDREERRKTFQQVLDLAREVIKGITEEKPVADKLAALDALYKKLEEEE